MQDTEFKRITFEDQEIAETSKRIDLKTNLFKIQAKALLSKNISLQKKYTGTNLCQILSPLFCMYFSLMISKLFRPINTQYLSDMPVLNNVPPALYNNSLTPLLIPSCLEWYMYDFENATQETKDFVFKNSSEPEGLLTNVITRYCDEYNVSVPYFKTPAPGLTINEEIILDYQKMNEKPFQFGEDSEIAYIMPDGALTFYEANKKRLNYKVQISDNQINEYRRNNGITKYGFVIDNYVYNVPRVFDGMISFIDLISRAYIQEINSRVFLVSGIQHMPRDPDAANYLIKILNITGTCLYPLALSLLLPVYLYTLVLEKEEKIRAMMKMNGLKLKYYWIVNYFWFVFLYCLVALLFFSIGYLQIQLPFFLETNTLILGLLLMSWGFCQVSYAYFLQAFIDKSKTAGVFGYLITNVTNIIGITLNIIIYPYPTIVPIYIRYFPPLSFARAIYIIAAECGNNRCITKFEHISPELAECMTAIVLGSIIFLLLASLLEKRKTSLHLSVKFMFSRLFSKQVKKSYIELSVSENEDISKETETEDADCQSEREATEKITNYENYPLVCKKLRKVYKGSNITREKIAVRNFSLTIQKGEIFGLLGPNGAGKSSLISIITGLYHPDLGCAWISGSNILTQAEEAHSKMGVCPQDNLLWPDLTVEEHLLFYSRLRGIRPFEEKQYVEKAIKEVALERFTHFRAKALSGGMQRRLSVAISLVGDPAITFLDEPTTGLDPENRRGLWDILTNLRGKRAIIITTHLMEEADLLCNRIGIITDGMLRCIGPQTHLKKLYGKGYYLFVNCFRDFKSYQKYFQINGNSPTKTKEVLPSNITYYHDKLIQFIKEILPMAELRSALNGNFFYQVPENNFKVSNIFQKLDSKRKELAIQDWGISQSSLEEVFLRIVNETTTVISEN